LAGCRQGNSLVTEVDAEILLKNAQKLRRKLKKKQSWSTLLKMLAQFGNPDVTIVK
jgi:hypothetical protein